jgi:hypothetical protein
MGKRPDGLDSQNGPEWSNSFTTIHEPDLKSHFLGTNTNMET